MKKQKLTLIAFLIIGVICTSCTNNRNNIREIPKQAKKRIITTYYQPILNNGIWICGGEMEESPERSTVYPDTAYYDEYNNLLLSINKGASIIKKNVYYSPSKQQLQSKCILLFILIEKYTTY